MATMEFQIRTALNLMARYPIVNRADLSLQGIGQRTIDALLDHELVATAADLAGRKTYSLTEKGKAQAAQPAPTAEPRSMPRLKTLQPRITEMEPRLKPRR